MREHVFAGTNKCANVKTSGERKTWSENYRAAALQFNCNGTPRVK
jgi:hypothetical protein